ncbi:MAG: alkane 1-monooxygenase [Bacteroidota bacterium]
MSDIKYLSAYIIPALTLLGLWAGGAWTYGAIIFTFGIIPLLDPLLPNSKVNIETNKKQIRLKNRFFDGLLYANVPLVYGILGYFLYTLHTQVMSPSEYWGNILSVGLVLGSNGINVAHELGHRSSKMENGLAKLLLLPSLYMHFIIEHNWGHHKHVATDQDPASARYNEWLYTFWFRSIGGSYLSAWKIEKTRLKKKKISFLSWRNEMLGFQIIQLAYVSLLLLLHPGMISFALLFAGLVGVLLLETINYVEHYGLRRKQLENGHYERVRPNHSWNSNFEMGRIVLYELTRHSDHHYLASKKYQVLDHHDEAPQLPWGYPTSMLLALLPPLWFLMINPKVKQIRNSALSLAQS